MKNTNRSHFGLPDLIAPHLLTDADQQRFFCCLEKESNVIFLACYLFGIIHAITINRRGAAILKRMVFSIVLSLPEPAEQHHCVADRIMPFKLQCANCWIEDIFTIHFYFTALDVIMWFFPILVNGSHFSSQRGPGPCILLQWCAELVTAPQGTVLVQD